MKKRTLGEENSGDCNSLNKHRKMSTDRTSFKHHNTDTCDNVKLPESRNGIDRIQLTKCNVSKKLVIKNFGSYSYCKILCLHFEKFVLFLHQPSHSFQKITWIKHGRSSKKLSYRSKVLNQQELRLRNSIKQFKICAPTKWRQRSTRNCEI